MRDQWRADGDYDERERYHHRHHHPRERDRPSRRPQSPEPSRRHHFERPSRGRGDNSSYYHSHRAISPSGARNARNTRATPSDSSAYRENRHAKQSLDNQVRPRQRGDPVPPPAYSPFPRRKRSRSPSPAHSRHRSHHSRHKRGGYQDIGDRPERGGRRPQRPHSPGRDTGHERDYLPYFKTPRSDSLYVSRRRRSRSPVPADFEPRSPPPSHPTNHFSRPLSRHSFASKASGQSSPSRHSQSMQSTRPTHSVVDEPLVSQPVFRPISSYDAASPQHSIDGDSHSHSTHSMHPSDSRGARRQTRPHVDTRPQYAPSPPYISGTDSRHTSPQSGSPYGGSRGSWTGQPSQPYPHAQQRQALEFLIYSS